MSSTNKALKEKISELGKVIVGLKLQVQDKPTSHTYGKTVNDLREKTKKQGEQLAMNAQEFNRLDAVIEMQKEAAGEKRKEIKELKEIIAGLKAPQRRTADIPEIARLQEEAEDREAVIRYLERRLNAKKGN